MRIIAGQAKGRRLIAPPGFTTRPTAERVREALFSALSCRITLEGARVLDAFAGSGALGLEALSRGAASALFIEGESRALGALRRNLESCRLPGAQLKAGNSLSIMGSLPPQSFELIFLDPPYHQGLLQRAALLIAEKALLAPEGLLIMEAASRGDEFSLPVGMEIIKHSVYGDTALYYCCRTE